MSDETILHYPLPRTGTIDPPEALMGLLQGRKPVRVQIWDGSEPWLVADYAQQRDILSDSRFSAQGLPGFPWQSASVKFRRQTHRTFSTMDNPDHDHYRRMLTGSFSAGRMNDLRPDVQKIVDSVLDRMLAAGSPGELVSQFAQPIPSSLICLLLGIDNDDHEYFQACARKLISQSTTAQEAAEASQGIQRVIQRAVDQNMDTPDDNILGRLVVNQLRTGQLSYDGVVSMGHELLLAGHSTTASAISFGVLALLDNPDELAKLRARDDPKLVRRAVEETLRYTSVAHIGRRRICVEDVEVGGVAIRAGEGVVLPDLASNRDELVFPDPDRLDLDRPPVTHMAFGYGIHSCLGQPLARLVLQVVYDTLFKRVPTMALAVPLDEVSFIYDTNILSIARLDVTW